MVGISHPMIVANCNYLLQYAGSRNRLRASLAEDNIYLSETEVSTVYDTYWNLYPGLREWNYQLKWEWKRNGGYILNGLGRPMAILPGDEKDLISRHIQSTAAGILVIYTNIVMKMLDEARIEWYPYIWNLHDALTIEVPIRYAKQVSAVLTKALVTLNSRLQGDLKITGKPVVGKTLADVKEAE